MERTVRSDRYTLGRDGERFYLGSPEFDATPDHREVGQLALEYLAVLNGAAVLEWGSSARIDVDLVEEVRDPLPNILCFDWVEEVDVMEEVVATLHNPDGSVAETSSTPNFGPWVRLTQQHASARTVLAYLADPELGWLGLWNVYEIIRQDLGGEKEIATRGYAPATELDRFRRTANSPSASGPGARHGVERGAPPSDPMTLSTARELIRALSRVWLRNKR